MPTNTHTVRTLAASLTLEEMRDSFMVMFHNTDDENLSDAIDAFVECIFDAQRALTKIYCNL